MKKLFVVVLMFRFIAICSAQISVKVYGNYVKSHCDDCFDNGVKFFQSYQVIVYFKDTDLVPDSITFRAGTNKVSSSNPRQYVKTSETKICNGLLKVVYETDSWFEFNRSFANATFTQDKVWYKGKNIPDSTPYMIHFENNLFGLKGYESNSPYFKDIPLITIEKGKSNVINLFDLDDDNDSLVFFYTKYSPNNPVPNLDDVNINTRTGDMYLPNNIDTGYYTLKIGITDYFVSYENYMKQVKATTIFDFTLHVVTEKLPYFIHNNPAKKDRQGINFVYASTNDKSISYEAEYINPKGLGNYSVSVPVTKLLDLAPKLLTTKVNDTLLRINITVFLDSLIINQINDIPFSTSIIVTNTDSLGVCKQDLTSFYITNNASTDVLEELRIKGTISIFPNPATSQLNITSNSNIKTVLIYNVTGKLVKELNYENNNLKNVSFAIDELTQGMYIVQIIDELDTKLTSKFIKE